MNDKRDFDSSKNNDYDRMSSPDQVNSDTESLFDTDESMKHVDPIPVEELNEKVKDERNKDATKKTSSSHKKFGKFGRDTQDG